MLEELKFSIGGMEGWTTVDVKVEKEKVHYVTENLFCGQGEETKLNKADSNLFLQKIEELKIGKWKAKYCPEMRICDGTQWQIDYKEEGKRCRHIYGDNAYPDNWDDFIEIMDTLYPFIDADAIQSIFIGFYAINSKYREQIDINRKDGAVMYETIFDDGSRMFSMYADKTGVKEFLDELQYSDLPKANTGDDEMIGEYAKVGKYKCRIICHSQEEITIEGIYDCDGVPENWADFINAIKDFLKGYERRELFNTEHF